MATAKKATTPRTKKAPKLQYKTVDLRSPKGFRQAEGLKARGWKVDSVGFHTVRMRNR